MTHIGTIKDIIAIVCPCISTVLVALISYMREKAINKEIAQLRQQLANTIEIPLVLKTGIYYDKESNAYCPACRAKSLFVPLSLLKRDTTKIVYKCPSCQVYFDVPPQ